MRDEDVVGVGHECFQDVLIGKIGFFVGVFAVIPTKSLRLVIMLLRSASRM